jgi:hypothetical protein
MKKGPSRSNIVRFALAAVVAHAAVGVLHAAAHQVLGVETSMAQQVFILAVIFVAPLVAGLLLWKKRTRAGAALLAGSMAGSLAFGVYYHFIADSPDHVAHVALMSPAGWAIVFQATALLLVLTEAGGICAGALALRKSRDHIH